MARKKGSIIRKRLIDILYLVGCLHGYGLWKIYCEIFGKITLRVVYYNLHVALENGEVILKKVNYKKGQFSWGNESLEKIYCLGENSKANPEKKLIEKINKIDLKKLGINIH